MSVESKLYYILNPLPPLLALLNLEHPLTKKHQTIITFVVYLILNADKITFELATVLNQMICSGRQVNFEIVRDINIVTGLNTTAKNCINLVVRLG